MTTTTETTWTPSPFFLKGRDKYGRTNYMLTLAARTLGAVVRLPRTSTKVAEGTPYLANAWGKGDDGRGLVTYHRTLAAAKGWLASELGQDANGMPETIS